MHMQSKFTFHASTSFWARKGNYISREFFRTHGPKAAREKIRCLRAQNGSLCIAPEEVMEIATKYYKELFLVKAPSPPRTKMPIASLEPHPNCRFTLDE